MVLNKNYKNIFFDLDGTIINSYPGIAEVLDKVFSLMSVTIDRSLYRSFIGPPLAQSFARLLPAEQVSTAHNLFREHYIINRGMMNYQLYDGIGAILASLKSRGYNLYVATSKREGPSVEILTHAGLIDNFTTVYGAQLDGRKEKYEILQFAIEDASLDVNECVLVGDTIFDINGAAKVGMDCVGVEYGFGNIEQMHSSTAIAVVKNVADIDRLFR